jgi:hypothetical protein
MFEQNLTLHCVCAACNAYFGKTIELAYARDSIEAYLRLHHGVKPADDVNDLRGTRLSLRLGGDDPAWNGCHVELREEEGQVTVDLVPQVAFARREGGWVFITEQTLADESQQLPADIDLSQGFRTISRSDDMTHQLIAALATRGIRFVQMGQGGPPPSEDGLAPLDVGMRFDATILRCVTKIAFNYTAWAAGADFVGSDSFDVARTYIRYGTEPPYPVVVRRRTPILADDTPTRRQTNGHLLTVDWALDRRSVVAQVSLFNGPTYAVSVARDYAGVFRPIRSGHHFDLETHQISPLGVTAAPLRTLLRRLFFRR